MKLLKGIAIFFLALGAVYLVGPKVETPVFSDKIPYVPTALDSLQPWIKAKEQVLGNVRLDNESKLSFMTLSLKKQLIVWFTFTDLLPLVKKRSGSPNGSQCFRANLYIPRLYGHGLEGRAHAQFQ